LTKLGKLIIDNPDNIDDTLLKCLLKWQIPNPLSKSYKRDSIYDINPFIGTLHLINEVNAIESERGNNPVGLQNREFALFVPTLVNFSEIKNQAEKIIDFRDLQKGKSQAERKRIRDRYRKNFISMLFNKTDEKEIKNTANNLRDYGDNIIRYFRLTKFITIRGGGYYVDLEPKRKIEINELLNKYSGQAKTFKEKTEYIEYLSNINLPEYPWETTEKLNQIQRDLIVEIEKYSNEKYSVLESSNVKKINQHIRELREVRTKLLLDSDKKRSQETNTLKTYIDDLRDIYNRDDRATALEHYGTLGLMALNDAISIKPNYPIGDDGKPTNTAPAGVADIECYYSDFNAICEVTMLKNRDQWFNEGQPVMRHLRDFENGGGNKNAKKDSFCLFIAPSIHRDTLNTFYMANKYEYEGEKQRIIPFTIKQFVSLLDTLLVLKEKNLPFSHRHILSLYKSIVSDLKDDSKEWLNSFDGVISKWSQELVNQ
jgi:hypothetical protein